MAGCCGQINPRQNPGMSCCLRQAGSVQPGTMFLCRRAASRVSDDSATIAEFALAGEAATLALGAALAPRLKAGDVVALWGDLGTGKTALSRGLIQALAGDPVEVPSPTFTLVQTYDFPDSPSLWHFDLYRLEDPEEAFELGIEDAFADCISLIEWPDRLGGYLPPRRLDVTLAYAGEGRTARLAGGGDWPARLKGLSL